jgi:hypothetical protein
MLSHVGINTPSKVALPEAGLWATDVLRSAANWHNREALHGRRSSSSASKFKGVALSAELSNLRLAPSSHFLLPICDSFRIIPWDHSCRKELAGKDDAGR